MKIEALSFDHQILLREKFQALGLCLSDYSFASRFLFRREYDFHLLFDEERIWLRGTKSDGIRFLMPTEDLRHILPMKLMEKLQWADCFYPIPEQWLAGLSHSHFQAGYHRNDSDYLFKREKIAEYPGRNLSAKRNLVKQFFDDYNAEIVPFEKKHTEDGLAVLNAWLKSFKGTQTDFLPCQDGLIFAEELGLSGYMIYIDKEPAAFILGESLRPNIYDIHFAKGLTQYKGIYPYLFKELATRLPSQEVSCLNWEQDLGQDGLRQSKLSYQPDKIAHKYCLFDKECLDLFAHLKNP